MPYDLPTIDNRRVVRITHARLSEQSWHSTDADAGIDYKSRSLGAAIEAATLPVVVNLRPEVDDVVVVEHHIPDVKAAGPVSLIEPTRDVAERAKAAERQAFWRAVSALRDVGGLSLRDAAVVLNVPLHELEPPSNQEDWDEQEAEQQAWEWNNGYRRHTHDPHSLGALVVVRYVESYDSALPAFRDEHPEIDFDFPDYEDEQYGHDDAAYEHFNNPDSPGFRREPWRVAFYDWVTETYTKPIDPAVVDRLHPRLNPQDWDLERTYLWDTLVKQFCTGELAEDIGRSMASRAGNFMFRNQFGHRFINASVHRYGPCHDDVDFPLNVVDEHGETSTW